MLHELFLTTRQITKIRNAIAENVSVDIKLKPQLPKMIQSGEHLRNILSNLSKKVMIDFDISLARDNLPGLVSNLASDAINKFARKIRGKGAVWAGKGLTLFILNEDMNYIVKTIKLEDSC